jgi:hypothetical protein
VVEETGLGRGGVGKLTGIGENGSSWACQSQRR